MNEINQALYEARVFAVRVQTLMSNIIGVSEHLTNIINMLAGIVGNVQAQQSAVQMLATSNQTMGTQAVQTSAYQRTEVFQASARSVVALSFNRIEADRWRGWSTW